MVCCRSHQVLGFELVQWLTRDFWYLERKVSHITGIRYNRRQNCGYTANQSVNKQLNPCLGTFEAKTFKYDLEHSRGDWLGNLANPANIKINYV